MAGVVLFLAGCGPRGEGPQEVETFIVALKPDKDPDAMLTERSRLETWLGNELGRPVEVIIPASGSVIEEGLANGTIDVAYVSSTSLARYREEEVADLLLAVEIEGKTSYQSYWVGLQEKPYRSVEDLAGKTICFASPTSTSGYIIPTYDLYRKGLIDEKSGPAGHFGAGNVLYGTGYVSAIKRVFNGQAEAAAVSDYVIEKDKHLTAEEKSRLRVVQAQGPVPTHCLAVRSSLSGEDRSDLRAAFLAMNGKNPELRDTVFTSILKEVDPNEHLASIEEALRFVQALSE